MVEFRWIKVSLLLILLLQITAENRKYSSTIIRDGDEVTLSCQILIQDQDDCDGTDWIKTTGSGKTVDLVTHGQIDDEAKAESDRLTVSENCSLVIKKVTVQDVGLYYCQQHKSGQQPEETQVVLSVVNMKVHEDGEQVMLSCSVSTHETCRHTVKWTYEGENADEDIRYTDMQTSHSECSVTVTFPTSFLKQNLKHYVLFKCAVTDGYIKIVELFPFSLQSSAETPGEDATTAITSTIRPSESSTKSKTNSTVPAVSVPSITPQSWWLYIFVAVGLVALLIITVAVIRWKRTKGNKTQMDDNTGQSLNTAMIQSARETSQDTADPGDGISYASISYTKKHNSTAQVQVKYVDDEGDSVTYSTVKASSSSAGASADLSDLYATTSGNNKPKK